LNRGVIGEPIQTKGFGGLDAGMAGLDCLMDVDYLEGSIVWKLKRLHESGQIKLTKR